MFPFPPFTAICLNVLALTCGPAPAWPGEPHPPEMHFICILSSCGGSGKAALDTRE